MTAGTSGSKRRVGVWLIGVNGGLATTLICGARMIARGLSSDGGLITSTPEFSGLKLPGLEDLVFGGHEIRKSSLYDSAYEIHHENGTIPYEALQEIREDLEEIDNSVRMGMVTNAGRAIRKIASNQARRRKLTLADSLKSIVDDLNEFRALHDLDELVVVNLSSTEPPLELSRDHKSMAGLNRIIREDRRSEIRPSTLYTYAALKCGCPYLNFTPSNASILPGHIKLAEKNKIPIMGNDGKTGETLVKSALAPMFKYRNLRVLTWQGYNILGDRDGEILSDDENKASKISSKDGLLRQILGYPLHTHVAIDYAPSLSDLKTAWDFVHFQGFLDYKMSLQFTWQGCDAILAAPIVLDMIRLLDHSHRNGESGLMTHLACFFKSPLGVGEQDLHFQFHHLLEYLENAKRRS